MLAVIHLLTCALNAKLYTLAEEATSKPPPLLHLIFVKFFRRSFWIELFKCRSRVARDVSHRSHPTNSSGGETPGTECVLLTEGRATGAHTHESASAEVTNKKNFGSEEASAKEMDAKETNAWMELFFALNRLTTAIYLIGNALVFSFFLVPLLYRMIVHYSVKEYVEDVSVSDLEKY